MAGFDLSDLQPFYKAAIQKIRFDEDGFLWFTTYQGLWRYDGTSVQAFDFTPYGIAFALTRTDFQWYDHHLVLVQANSLFIIDPITKKVVKQTIRSSQGALGMDLAGKLFFLNISTLVISNVYPNPASSTIGLSVESNTSGSLVFTISDLAGRHLKKEPRIVSAGINAIELNVSSMPACLYILQVANSRGEEVRTSFIKQ